MDIEFKTKDISFTCKVKETETGNKILKLLPIKSKISTWGDEIYF